MNTVNVIEIPDTENMCVAQLLCFPDNEEGNKKAEEIFVRLVQENDLNVTDDDIDVVLDNGYYNDGYGYWIGIVHNTNLGDNNDN